MIRAAITLGMMALPGAAAALSLEFPAGTRQAAEQLEPMTSFRLPIGPYDAGEVPTIWAEGALAKRAWQLPVQGHTTLQILSPLRAQLQAEGFEVVFECADADCGGFDFRYAIPVLPEPDMHVDLGDFRYLSAQRMGDERPEYAGLLVSRSSTRGFVQLVQIGPEAAVPLSVSTSAKPLPATPLVTGELAAQLEQVGRVVLNDLTFQTGSSQLGAGEFTSLTELAKYLRANPSRQIVLVGHTDAEGSLEGNIALSRKRARSVAEHLRQTYDIPSAQIDAQGVGYLSPLAANLDAESRAKNRRVEAILASTQ